MDNGRKTILVSTDAGHVAFDKDECTVTLAFDNWGQASELLAQLPARNRVRVVDDE